MSHLTRKNGLDLDPRLQRPPFWRDIVLGLAALLALTVLMLVFLWIAWKPWW
jgi:hypothetical protein